MPTHLGMSHWGQAELADARPPPPPQGVVTASWLGFTGKQVNPHISTWENGHKE